MLDNLSFVPFKVKHVLFAGVLRKVVFMLILLSYFDCFVFKKVLAILSDCYFLSKSSVKV
jgi:hypothetical protein